MKSKKFVLVLFALIIIGTLSHNKVLSQTEEEVNSFSVQMTNLYYPGEKASLQIYSYDYSEKSPQKTKKFEFKILRIKNIVNFYSNQSSTYYISTIGKDSSNLIYYTEEVKSITKKFTSKKDYYYYYINEFVELGKFDIGAYIVQVKSGRFIAYTGFIVSPFGVISEVGNNNFLAFVVDRKTGEPINDAELEFFQNGKSKFKGNTKNGILYGEYSPDYKEINKGGVNVLLIGSKDNQLIISNPYAFYMFPDEIYSVYITTQQPVYRTGSEVLFKATIKEKDIYGFKSFANKEVNVKINDPKGQTVYETKMFSNENGSISGSYKIDDDANLGDYIIYITISENKIYNKSFTVEQYKKPEYKVTVSTDKSQYYGKDELKASISAVYFFGNPVSEADVEYNIYKIRYFTPWWKFTDYAWWYEDNEFYSEVENDFTGAQMIFSGKGKLDKNGKFDFQYNINEDFKEEYPNYWWWWRDYYTDYKYIIQARVVDKSRREISGVSTIFVTRGGFYTNIKTGKYFYKPGETVDFNINALNFSEKPIETDYKLEIFKTKYSWYYDDKNVNKELVKTIRGRTKSDGKSIEYYEIPSSGSEGYYEAKLTALDERGNEITSSTSFYVYSGDTWWWYSQDQRSLQIVFDKDSYKKGEICKAFIMTPDEDVDLIASAKTENVLYYKNLKSNKKSAVIEFLIDDKFNSGFAFTVSYVKNFQLYTETKKVNVIPEDKFLTVELLPSKYSYKPREEGELKIRVVDFKGNPVGNAEVSLGIVDESIYSIKEDKTKDVRQFFYSSLKSFINTSFNVPSTIYGYSRLISIYEHFNLKSAKESELGTIRGTLFDKDKKPVAGAIIVIDDEFYADKTSITGEFEFKLPEGEYEISVFMGDEKSDAVAKIKIKKGEIKTIKLYTEKDLNKYINIEQKQLEVETVRPLDGEKDREVYVKKEEKKVKGDDKLVLPEVRSDFRDAIVWLPFIRTDKDGCAYINVKYPDNLTEWRMTARVITEDTKVGQVIAKVVTRKDLLVRMETPRFLQSDDELSITTIIHNYLNNEKYTKVKFSVNGVKLIGDSIKEINLQSNSEQSIDWKIKVDNPYGYAKLYCEALTNEESDAVEINVPLQPRGLEMVNMIVSDISEDWKTETKSFTIPDYIDIRSAGIKFSVSPSIASTLLTSLDELVGYPYGCVEQTMSRFLPSIVVAEAFKKLDVPLSDKTKKELPDMVNQGLKRLYSMQHSDGGWGWWINDNSNPYMTAYVVYGLTIAKNAGYDIKNGVYSKGLSALKSLYNSADNNVTKAYILYVLSLSEDKDSKFIEKELLNIKYKDINDYARSLIALSYLNIGDKTSALIEIDKLTETAKKVGEELVYWECSNFRYTWQEDKVQTTAMALKALVNIKPDSPLIEKTVRWLLMHRKGMSWRSTQETALIVYSLIDYLMISNELQPDFVVKVFLNNEIIYEKPFTKNDIYKKDSILKIPYFKINKGINEIKLEKSGKGKLYFSGNVYFFDNSASIKATENWFRVEREYYRLEKYSHYAEDKITYRKKYFGGEVNSGDIIFVKLKVYSKEKELYYFMLEEPIPAGCEVVKDDWAYQIEDEKNYEGYKYYFWRWWYADKDIRDNKITFFATYLYGGEHEFSYLMRAQIPGMYFVNPSRAMLMYYPEINGNTSDLRITIKE
ncbi:MAG: MG2 domain-containing protein [Ignavibacteria bacterium]|nr:MG2 domain-containing protein [Ignavibacteria bacterium]